MPKGILLDKTVPCVGPLLRRHAALCLVVSGLLIPAQALKAPCTVPPMGWNSYDCWNYAVTESQFMQNAHYLANLKQYGWQYCVVDFVWWIPLNGIYGNNQSGNWNFGKIDQYGRFLPDTTRFPSSRGGRGFKPLADSVHNLGLKFGIHIMRGVPRMAVRSNYTIYNSTYTCSQAANTGSTCPWLDWMYGANNNAAGQAYFNSIFTLYDSWDVDYVKIDDLSAQTYHAAEVVMYANSIAGVSREIVFSTSPGATPVNQANHVSQYANMWRLVNDFWDVDVNGNKNWTDIVNAFNVDESWRATSVQWGQGVWPDVDMLPFGHISLYGPRWNPRYSLSTLTKGEHRLIYLLWCVNNGPLMWGGNLPDNTNDRFYDSLMTNVDAIFINQRGIRARNLRAQNTGTPIWTSTHPTDTTTKFLMLGNTSGSSQTISVTLSTIGITGTVPVRDAWTGAGLGNFTTTFSRTIPSHDAGLYILGNGSTEVAPVEHIEKFTLPAAEKIFFTTNSRCFIPAAFAGKTVKVSVFGLDGKMVNSVITRDRSIRLYKNESQGEKVGIIKITEIR
jgi:alpha-galactosidase